MLSLKYRISIKMDIGITEGNVMATDDDDEDETGDFTFDVHVVDEDDEPVKSAKVFISFGLWYGQSSEYTDEDGHASFLIPDCPFAGRATTITIFVNGKEIDEYHVEDGDGFTIQI